MSKNIFILGSPRSGTTWIQELISNKKRLFLEPNHVKSLNAFHGITLMNSTMKTPYERRLYKFYLDEVMKGNCPLWTKRLGHVKKFWYDRKWYKDTVVKFIHGNFNISSLIEDYPHSRFIYVMRNPFDTIESQIRSKWFDGKFIYSTIIKNNHIRHFLFKSGYSCPDDVFEKSNEEVLTICWVLQNKFIQDFMKNNDHAKRKIFTIKYDTFKDDFSNIKRLFEHIEEDIPRNIHSKISKKSVSTLPYFKVKDEETRSMIKETIEPFNLWW